MPKAIIFLLIILILILILGVYFSLPKLLKKPVIEETETKLEAVPEKLERVSIITLYDNYLIDSRLKTGWGFSCLIKTNKKMILFDTGADSETLLSNMEKMKTSPKQIDLVVLSHIHGDHIGGLEGILRENRDISVYIPSSFPDSMRRNIETYGAKYQDVKKARKISEGVWSAGELGTWIKEQSLVINSEKGLIVITGCAHPGIVNIIEKAKEMFPKQSVYLVLGGFHLSGASDSELKGIIDKFRKIGVQKTAPCHCSGNRCRELFKKEYQNDFIENGVGKIINIE